MSSPHALPEWDLSDFYKNLTDPQITEDLKTVDQKSQDFVLHYTSLFKGHSWQAKDLKKAIEDYEEIQERLGRLASYACLLYNKNLEDPEIGLFYQKIYEQITVFSEKVIFFTLDLNKIPQEKINKAYEEEPLLKKYETWIVKNRTFVDHQLSQELEHLFLEKSLTSFQAWNRLYDETLSRMRFHFNKNVLNLSEVLKYMESPLKEERREAAISLSEGLQAHLPVLSLGFNTLLKDKAIECRWRRFDSPLQSKNLENQIDGEAVEALVSSVKKAYSRLSHRYYALKAKVLGLDYLQYWDRNAPLVSDSKDISWLEAKEIVLSAFESFSPLFASIAQKFFEHSWIDATVHEGKTSGAFSHPTVPSVHPYILLNYQGKTSDVMTLAHELGHGVHQYLSASQGYLISDTPLTLAETASVFAEMLTFQSLLSKAQTPQEKLALLGGKIDSMMNTVVRQIAFHEFEVAVHSHRQNQELTTQDLSNYWMQTQKEALGEGVHLDPIIGCYWAYITHFTHSPFYVYAYAVGDCFVNSLYTFYQKNPQGFPETYEEILSKGGVLSYKEVLGRFGMNPNDPSFWDQGLGLIESFIDQFEDLYKVHQAGKNG